MSGGEVSNYFLSNFFPKRFILYGVITDYSEDQPWDREAWHATIHGRKESDTTEQLI